MRSEISPWLANRCESGAAAMNIAHREIVPAMGVELACFANLSGSDSRNLVTASASSLSVYALRPRHEASGKESEKKAKLVQVAHAPLLEQPLSIARIVLHGAPAQALASLDQVELIAASFRGGKCSLFAMDPSSASLCTVSAVSFAEELATLARCVSLPAFAAKRTEAGASAAGTIAVDPQFRCSAMMVYDEFLAVLPLQPPSALSAPSQPQNSPLQHWDGGAAARVGYLASLVHRHPLLVSLADMGPRGVAGTVRSLGFLDGFLSPTVALLVERVPTCPGRLGHVAHTCLLVAITLDGVGPESPALDLAGLKEGEQHSITAQTDEEAPDAETKQPSVRRMPIAWTAEGLPHDSFAVVPVSAPVGGAVVLTNSAVLYAAHGKCVGCPVNGFANVSLNRATVRVTPPVGAAVPSIESSLAGALGTGTAGDDSVRRPPINSSLQGCSYSWVSPTRLLLVPETGEALIASLVVGAGGREVVAVDVARTGVVLPTPSALTSMGYTWLFAASRRADSMLLSYALADGKASDAPTSSALDGEAKRAKVVVSNAITLESHDRLRCTAPLFSACLAHAPMPLGVQEKRKGLVHEVEMLACAGVGKGGALLTIRQGLRVNPVSPPLPLPGCVGVFAAGFSAEALAVHAGDAAAVDASGSPFDQYVLMSFKDSTRVLKSGANLSEIKGDACPFLIDSPTLSVGAVAQGWGIVQVHPKGARVVLPKHEAVDCLLHPADPSSKVPSLVLDTGEGSDDVSVRSASINGSWVCLLLSDGSVSLTQAWTEDEEDADDDVPHDCKVGRLCLAKGPRIQPRGDEFSACFVFSDQSRTLLRAVQRDRRRREQSIAAELLASERSQLLTPGMDGKLIPPSSSELPVQRARPWCESNEPVTADPPRKSDTLASSEPVGLHSEGLDAPTTIGGGNADDEGLDVLFGQGDAAALKLGLDDQAAFDVFGAPPSSSLPGLEDAGLPGMEEDARLPGMDAGLDHSAASSAPGSRKRMREDDVEEVKDEDVVVRDGAELTIQGGEDDVVAEGGEEDGLAGSEPEDEVVGALHEDDDEEDTEFVFLARKSGRLQILSLTDFALVFDNFEAGCGPEVLANDDEALARRELGIREVRGESTDASLDVYVSELLVSPVGGRMCMTMVLSTGALLVYALGPAGLPSASSRTAELSKRGMAELDWRWGNVLRWTKLASSETTVPPKTFGSASAKYSSRPSLVQVSDLSGWGPAVGVLTSQPVWVVSSRGFPTVLPMGAPDVPGVAPNDPSKPTPTELAAEAADTDCARSAAGIGKAAGPHNLSFGGASVVPFPVASMTAYHSPSCQRGLVAVLPHRGLLSIARVQSPDPNTWIAGRAVISRLPVKATPRQVLYCRAASTIPRVAPPTPPGAAPAPPPPSVIDPVIAIVVQVDENTPWGEEKQLEAQRMEQLGPEYVQMEFGPHVEFFEPAEAKMPPIAVPRFEARIFERRTGRTVARIPLERCERVMCLAELPFSFTAQGRPESIVAIGTGFVTPRGEDEVSHSRLIFLRVHRAPGAEGLPTGSLQVSLLEKRELRSRGVTCVAPMPTASAKFVVVGSGFRVSVLRWNFGTFEQVGFHDVRYWVSSLAVARTFIAVGDAYDSVRFFAWKEAERTMSELAMDLRKLPVLAMDTIVSGSHLGIVATTVEGDVAVFEYLHRELGTRLALTSSLHLGAPAASLVRIRLHPTDFATGAPMSPEEAKGVNRFGLLYTTTNGSIGLLLPVDDAPHRAAALMGAVHSFTVPSTGALHPSTALGARMSRRVGGGITDIQSGKACRDVVDARAWLSWAASGDRRTLRDVELVSGQAPGALEAVAVAVDRAAMVM
jgi:hypothetical protein